MITKKCEEILTNLVKEFINSRNGFYKEHCSDEFLAELIIQYLQKPIPNGSCESYLESIMNGDVNAAYNSVCWIFELILECKCKAGGNGHHVAQEFAQYIMSNVDNLKQLLITRN